jgi:peptidoglycan/xylan/chitin deacetylase (PgdA/CDA1 family)
VNRLALAGFIFCYWILYLEATGYQFGEQPTVAATPAQELTQSTKAEVQKQAKTTIAHAPTQPKINFTVPPQFQGQVVYEATPPANAPKVVALTFDDGPWATTTDQILDILQKNNIKATFYWVGKALQENGEIAKKVVAQGHAIGNHTWQHLMDNMDELTAAEELGNNAKLIYQTTGVRTALMRPPGGNLGGELVNYAKKQGYMPTMWSADSSDYLVSTPLIIDNVLSNTKPGGIVLMHDGGGDRSPTVEALPQIITSLQRQGYQFVTVPELMNMQAQWGPIKSAGEEEMVPPSSTEAEKSQSADPALQSTPSPSSQAQPQPDGSPLPNSVPAPTPIPQTNHHLPLNQTPQPDASVQPPSNHSQDSTSQPGNPPQPASTPQSGTTGTTQPNLNPPIHDQSQPVTNPPIRDHAQ